MRIIGKTIFAALVPLMLSGCSPVVDVDEAVSLIKFQYAQYTYYSISSLDVDEKQTKEPAIVGRNDEFMTSLSVYDCRSEKSVPSTQEEFDLSVCEVSYKLEGRDKLKKAWFVRAPGAQWDLAMVSDK